jgi:hypothetical protein
MVYRYDRNEKHYADISKMRSPLPPLEGVDHPSWLAWAPAGGATAEAPEGGALACPSASPHIPVVSARNPVDVPSLARSGIKRAGTAIRAIGSCQESLVHVALNKEFMYTSGPKIPRSARPICLFVARYYSMPSYLGGIGHVSQERVVAMRVRAD